MFKYFLKIALRNFYRNKLYTLINVSGLALGLTVSFIIFSWVLSELNYDKFNKDHERIGRLVIMDEKGNGRASVSPAVKPLLLDRIPEVENSVRIFKSGFSGEKTKVVYQDKVFTNDEIMYADSDFFEIFSFPFRSGNGGAALVKSNSAVITEKTARKYFGDDDPVGKILQISDNVLLEVTAVLKNLPPSHIYFDILVSMKSHPWGDDLSGCGLGSCWVFNTYMKLHPNVPAEIIIGKINSILPDVLDPQQARDYQDIFKIQRLTDIHLKSSLDMELGANNDIKYVYLFSTISILVLLMAGINYINLATACSFERFKEVGVRKVLGAFKSQLMIQYLGESVLITLGSLFISVILIELIQPALSVNNNFMFSGIYGNIPLLLALAGIAVIYGMIAGYFPSMVLSSFNPLAILKAGTGITDSKGGLRKALVVIQFSISIILLICTGIIYQQLHYMKNIKLGYTKDHVLILNTGYSDILENYENFKNDLLMDSRIIAATMVSQLPIDILTGEYIDIHENKYSVFYLSIDPDFFKTMNVRVISGSANIEDLKPENYQNRYVINEQAMNEIGWEAEEALGQELSIRHGNMKPGPVIGIVEDFNFQSMHHSRGPLVFEFVPGDYKYMLLRINPGNIDETLKFIGSRWKDISGGIPFEFSFLDQEYDRLYKSETRAGNLFFVFAMISILIAMMGLFGLASFAAFKRTREIGIRKVFGASTLGILRLLSGDFAFLVLISFLISLPISYLLMNLWLSEFAYKVEINPIIIILAGLSVLILALLTVGYHSIRASNSDPVKTLRYE